MTLLTLVALAAEPTPTAPTTASLQPWSAFGPRTPADSFLLTVGVGWPGLSIGAEKGFGPSVALGARASLNWGYEGFLTSTMGVKLQGTLRATLADNGRVSLGVNAAPGVFLYFPSGTRMVGLTFPIGLALGVALGEVASLTFSVDLPMFVRFGAGFALTVPVLPGAAVEFFITRNAAVFVRGKGGPTFYSYGGAATPCVEGALGFSLRL